MKRSIVLFELLLSLLLLSIITLFSMQFYKQLHEINKSEMQQQLHALQMQSSKLFLDHLFKKGLLFEVTSQKVQFFEKEHKAFLKGLYTGLADIQNSSKIKVHTPNSQMGKLNKVYGIYFNNQHWYEIVPHSQNEYIFFKNPHTSKTIYEHYHIIEKQSSVFFKKDTLFYNNHIVLDGISEFKLFQSNELLNMHVCHENQCQTWRFKL